MCALKNLRTRRSFQRRLVLAGFLGLAVWMFHVVAIQPLAASWTIEAWSDASENRFETEDSTCRKQSTQSARARFRQLPDVHVPRVGIDTVRRVLPSLALNHPPLLPSQNPAWPLPLRC